MSYYTTEITITLPYALFDVAAKVGRSLDPDVGGANSFHRVIKDFNQDGEPTYMDLIRTTFPCTEQFKINAEYMMLNPSALFTACQTDSNLRWKGEGHPTMNECINFCNNIKET
jgi:hypothetical protein